MQHAVFLFCLYVATMLLAGCGTKGDLYLPDDSDKKFTQSLADEHQPQKQP